MHDLPGAGASAVVSLNEPAAVLQEDGFLVRSYQHGDGPAINRGFNEIFGLQRPLEEWCWKFQPETNDCWITVAIDQAGELIAHFGVNRHWVKVFEDIHCAGQAMDVYRLKRQGTQEKRVFTATVQDFYRRYGQVDKISFLFGFPGTRHMEMGRDRLGYAAPVPVPVWSRTVGAKRLWWKRYEINQHCESTTIDALWKRSAHRYQVAVVRNYERLVRRYLSKPNHDYIQLTAGKGRDISAWAVLKRAGNMVQWIDLLWDGEDQHALIALDDAAERIAQENQVDRLELWLAQDRQAAEILEQRGWVMGEHPQKLHMTSISFNPALDERKLLDSFYFTMGDSDLV